jgi:hypothetical protein
VNNTRRKLQTNGYKFFMPASRALSRQRVKCAARFSRQGPWNVDLRTPPGPEGSNGSLLRICRGHPDTLSIQNEKCKIKNAGLAGGQFIARRFPFLILHF